MKNSPARTFAGITLITLRQSQKALNVLPIRTEVNAFLSNDVQEPASCRLRHQTKGHYASPLHHGAAAKMFCLLVYKSLGTPLFPESSCFWTHYRLNEPLLTT